MAKKKSKISRPTGLGLGPSPSFPKMNEPNTKILTESSRQSVVISITMFDQSTEISIQKQPFVRFD